MARWLTLHDVAQAIVLQNPRITKDELAEQVARHFGLARGRKEYFADDFAVRFCQCSTASFTGTVISLAIIQKYDDRPFLVCLLRPGRVETFLANSTFVRKISHTSHALALGNVRGSINGTNILRELDGIPNRPDRFEELFARHAAFTWEENLARIVEATEGIAPVGARFEPKEGDEQRILNSAELSQRITEEGLGADAEAQLLAIIDQRAEAILEAAQTDNAKTRGDLIEKIITRNSALHRLEDLRFDLPHAIGLLVDIKSKLLDRASCPKLYNIDKALRELAQGGTAMSLFLIGVDPAQRRVTGRLVSILDSVILRATRIQFHWAGRRSRGVTQLTGDVSDILSACFRPQVDLAEATEFLKRLLAR